MIFHYDILIHSDILKLSQYNFFQFYFIFYFIIIIFFFLLYNIVLVLPYINMHLHGCTRVPHPEPHSYLPPHTIPLGPNAPAPSFLYPASKYN